MRIAVIGNSHLAAYQLGWHSIQEHYPGIQVIFFGSPTTSMRALRVESKSLVPTKDLVRQNLVWTSGGLDHVPGDFDAYVLVGMGVSLVHLMSLLKIHRPPSFYDPADKEQQLVSDRAFSCFMGATLGNSTGLMVLDKLKLITGAPVIYAPNPYPSTRLLHDITYQYYTDGPTRAMVCDFYKGFLPSLVRRGAVVFDQPFESVVDNMFTKDEFCRGSVKLKPGMSSLHRADDYFHMNAKFGRLSLEGLIGGYFGLPPPVG